MESLALKKAWASLRHWLHPDHPRVVRRRLLAGGAALMAAWFLFGGRQGLFALAMSQREKSQLRDQITQLQADNVKLEAEARELADDPASCEKTAREQLQLMRPGEIIYRFE